MKYIEDFNGRLRYRKRRDAFVDTQRIVLEDERLSGAWVRYGEKNKDGLQESCWGRSYRQGRIVVVQDPLVNVARALSVAYPKKWIVAVNPGSAARPGGRVHIGESGVEESLCLCSDLYSTLAMPGIWKKFYMKHLAGIYHKTEYPELMDEWLYSGNVTIFKEIRDGVPYLLPENEWGNIDVITSAPPGALRDDLWTGYAGSSDMERTILYSVYVLQGRNIFEAAIHAGGEYGDKMPHILVLPAFGCDLVRKDPTNLVAEAYAELLKSYAEYFDMVVFAAGRRSAVFCEVFEKKGLTLQTLEDIQEPWQDEPELDDGRKLGPKEEALCADTSEQEVEEAVLRQMAEYSNVVSAEPNNKFCDVTDSILTVGWNGEAWKGRNGWYTAGVFTGGKSFVEECIRLPKDFSDSTQEYRIFYMDTLSPYEKAKGKTDDEKEKLFFPMLPPQKVLEKRGFVSKMMLGEISEDMRVFEDYVRYLAGQGVVLSSSNCYRGALQYMTDWRGNEVVCVMIALDGQMSSYSNVVSAEPNNKFCDVTGSILTAGWNGEAWKGRNGLYTAGVFTDGKSFVEELIWLPLDGNRVTQGYEMFYMHTIDVYEKPKGKDDEKATRFVPMIPPKKVLKKRAFASKMTLGEISEDMWKFEHYVRYIAGWGLLLSPSNRYRGVLQYMTDRRGKEVVCVMVALRDNEERYAFSGRGDSY